MPINTRIKLTIFFKKKLFIEIHFNGVTLDKFDKIVNPAKTSFHELKHFIILFHSFPLNNCGCLKYHQHQLNHN